MEGRFDGTPSASEGESSSAYLTFFRAEGGRRRLEVRGFALARCPSRSSQTLQENLGFQQICGIESFCELIVD
jgi:hypothetical protein